MLILSDSFVFPVKLILCESFILIFCWFHWSLFVKKSFLIVSLQLKGNFFFFFIYVSVLDNLILRIKFIIWNALIWLTFFSTLTPFRNLIYYFFNFFGNLRHINSSFSLINRLKFPIVSDKNLVLHCWSSSKILPWLNLFLSCNRHFMLLHFSINFSFSGFLFTFLSHFRLLV